MGQARQSRNHLSWQTITHERGVGGVQLQVRQACECRQCCCCVCCGAIKQEAAVDLQPRELGAADLQHALMVAAGAQLQVYASEAEAAQLRALAGEVSDAGLGGPWADNDTPLGPTP